MLNLAEKIQTLSLTATEIKIADYLLVNMNTLGVKTITSLSADIGVSDASIFRFLRKLGYKGYSDFREDYITYITQQYAPEAKPLKSGEKFSLTNQYTSGDNILKSVVLQAQNNLEKISDTVTNKQIGAVADIILSSRRKYITGFRAASTCAQYMSSKLSLLCPEVSPHTKGDASAIESIIDISDRDCLIMYSYSKYSEINYQIIDIAHSNGAKIILFTDHLVTSLTGKADIVLATNVNGVGFTMSFIPPLCVSEAILLAVSGKSDETAKRRTEMIDQLLENNQLY